MNKLKRNSWILGSLIFLTVLTLLILIPGPLFSPASAIGCNGPQNYPPIPSKLVPLPTTPYNNCMVDGMAKINAETFNKEEGEIRSAMNACLLARGIDSVKDGIHVTQAGVQTVIDCKKAVMEDKGITEDMGSGILGPGAPPIARPRTSPFKNNCPDVGTRIIFYGGGHAFACTVEKCNPKTGEATLSCQESNFKRPIDGRFGAGWKYNVDIDGNGRISTPGASTDGGEAWGWIKIIHY